VGRLVNEATQLWVNQYLLVNIPLRIDIGSHFTRPIVIDNRNGSHRIRTFAGDDRIHSGNNGGFSNVDGGSGTVVGASSSVREAKGDGQRAIVGATHGTPFR